MKQSARAGPRGLLAAAGSATIFLLLGAHCIASSQELNHHQHYHHHHHNNQNATLLIEKHKALGKSLSKDPLTQQVADGLLSAASGGLGLPMAAREPASSLSGALLRTFVRTNSMRAYHLDLHSYRPEARFSGDPSHVDSQSAEHQARCSRHLAHYDHLLRLFWATDPVQASAQLEALRLADLFGRPGSGLLSGNQFWLGDYDKCLEHQVAWDAGGEAPKAASEMASAKIQSQYCLGMAQFPNWNRQDSKTAIKVGLCLPETCTSSMLNDQAGHLFEMVERMMKYQFGGPDSPFNRLQLRQVYCLPHETSEARQFGLSARLFIAVIAIFLSLCLFATLYEHLDRKLPENLKRLGAPNGNKRHMRTVLIESFAIQRNWNKIFRVRPLVGPPVAEPPVDGGPEQMVFDETVFFNSIAGLKCLGLIWIICAHTFLVGPIVDRNLIEMDKLTQTYLANIYLTAHLMVDTFFALSGLLASYLIFRTGLDKFNTSTWLLTTVHRYWRLTPVYLLSYWFTKSVGHLINSGPLWDFGTAAQSPRLNCANESWLTAVLHLSDFKSPKEHCVPFAWFIANGIKFWLITPFVLILIHRSVRRGYQLTCAAILANIGLVAHLAMSSNVDMKSVIEFKPESADNMLNNMGEVYTRPYSRVGAYLIGLLAGHLIYRIESKQLQVNLSKQVKILIWSLFSATIVVLTFVLKIAHGFPIDEAAIPWVFGLSSALIRPLWALCTCWLVFALAHGQARWAANFLTATCWQIIVRLSFAAYIVQGEVIAQLYLTLSESRLFTYSDLVLRPILTTTMTLAASVVVALLIEYPLIGIEELILHQKGTERLRERDEPKVTEPISKSSTTAQQQVALREAKLKDC